MSFTHKHSNILTLEERIRSAHAQRSVAAGYWIGTLLAKWSKAMSAFPHWVRAPHR